MPIPYTDEELKKSVYYPGHGCDLRAIFAFSNISNLFIYVDWTCNGKDIMRTLKDSSFRYRSFKEFLELGETKDVEINFGQNAPSGFQMTQEECTDYGTDMQDKWHKIHPALALNLPNIDHQNNMHFHHLVHDFCHDCSITELTLRRRLGNASRTVRLLCVPADAIGAYCYFYRSGTIAPMAVITTRTGMMGRVKLEQPNGIMSRLLQSCDQKPPLWVRLNELEDDFYNTPVQKFSKWAGDVIAYRCNNTNFELRDSVVFNDADNRKVTLRYRKLTPEYFTDFDVVFLTVQEYKRNPANQQPNVACYPQGFHDLNETLNYIDNYCTKHNKKRAVMIPCGYEDEGVIFEEWIDRTGLPKELEVYFDGEFDFADLRGFGNG